MKNLYTFFISILITQLTFAQVTAPAIDWQRDLGGSEGDGVGIIHQMPDGSYIMATSSYSDISGDKTEGVLEGDDYWVVKLDSNRNIIWQNTIQGSGSETLTAMELTPDGGCIMGGYSNAHDPSADKAEHGFDGYDYWVVKIDTFGGLEWEKTIGGHDNDYLSCIALTSEGGYIIGGYSNSGNTGEKTEASNGQYDYWVLKLNSHGHVQWQNSIGGSGTEYLYSIQQTSDHGYILAGTSESPLSGDKTEALSGSFDYWIIKLTNTGTISWQNTIGGSLYDYGKDIRQLPDGGYIVAGTSSSPVSGDKTEGNIGEADYWIIRLDATGNIIWQNTIGGNKPDGAECIAVTADGYIIGGNSYSNISGDKTQNHVGSAHNQRYDYWVVKIDTAGNVLWDKNMGTSADEIVGSIEYEADGSYLIGGYSAGGVSGDKTIPQYGNGDVWIIKLHPDAVCTISPAISAGGALTFCETGSVMLNAATGAGYSYQWKLAGSPISGATSASYNATAAGDYTVEITSAVCSIISDAITVTVVNKPTSTISNLDATNNLCFDPSIKLKATAGAGYTYQWNKDGSTIAGATGQIYYATVAGNYKVKVTNSTGCSKTSAAYTVINACREMQDTFSDIKIHPNPSNGNFTIQLPDFNDNNIFISVKNILGEEIYVEQMNAVSDHEIRLPHNILNGMYFVEAGTGNKIYSAQIIIVK